MNKEGWGRPYRFGRDNTTREDTVRGRDACAVEDGLATITINRPERMNAFRARTVDELIHCFKPAWARVGRRRA